MTISQIISAARAILPAGSPLIEKMERAKDLAGGFSSTPDGVKDMMRKFGKTSDDLRQALSMLDNPMVGGMLNRIAPGMVENLRSTGSQLLGGASSESQVPARNPDALASLREKLSKL